MADLKNGYAYSIKDLQSKGINCLLNHEVTKIDSTNQILYVKTSGDSMTLTYDYLILAMGGKGFTEEPVAALIDPHSYESSLKSFEKLQKAKTVLIVGGGTIGIEACEAYQRAGKADDGQILGIQWLSLAPLQAELALLMTGLQAKFSEDDFLVQAPPFYSGKSLIQFDLYKALYHHKSLRQKEAHLC